MHPASAGKHQRPRYPRKATVPPYAAAIQFLGREPDPPQSDSRSSAAIQLLPPSGVTAAIAERYMPLQLRKDVCSSPGVAMNGNKERPSLFRWPSSVARKSGSCSSYFGSLFCKKNKQLGRGLERKLASLTGLCHRLNAIAHAHREFAPNFEQADGLACWTTDQLCPIRCRTSGFQLTAKQLRGTMTHCNTMRIKSLSQPGVAHTQRNAVPHRSEWPPLTQARKSECLLHTVPTRSSTSCGKIAEERMSVSCGAGSSIQAILQNLHPSPQDDCTHRSRADPSHQREARLELKGGRKSARATAVAFPSILAGRRQQFDPQKLPQRHDGSSCGRSLQHREADCRLC